MEPFGIPAELTPPSTEIFDSHAHYDDPQFAADRETLLPALKAFGVSGILNCGCDLASSRASVALAEQYDFVYAAVGVHPEQVLAMQVGELEEIRSLYAHPKVVAVGEIGLDYHYCADSAEAQKQVFAAQLELAVALDLPVVIHDREAHGDTLALLQKYKPRGVLHCFSGSVEMARQVLRLGMYIGLGGAVTFRNARKPLEVAAMVPPDRLLTETDAPYMAPVPYRGKRDHSALIACSADILAQVRGIDRDTLLSQCAENARTLFHI